MRRDERPLCGHEPVWIRFGAGHDPLVDWARHVEHMRRHRSASRLHVAYRDKAGRRALVRLRIRRART